VHLVEGPVYVLDVLGLLGSKMMSRALAAIWGHPEWKQPWGFVILTHEGVRYEPDLRGYSMPPHDRRAVNTAVVSKQQLHRMVIGTIGISLRLAKSFPLEVFPDIHDAIEATRRHVAAARAQGRPY